ncbi:MAG TPA: hypothetical protein VEG27_02160 [Usitatibacter sp.]|nr:hypothetical protein [Usitatibacter sp.]
MGTRRIATLLVCAGFLAGIALDRLWLAAALPAFSSALLAQPGLMLSGAKVLGGFTFGVLAPVLLALLVLALALFPWAHASYPVARRERFRLIGRMSGIILLVPLWIVAAGFVYRLVKPYLPPPASTILESFGFQPSLYYRVPDDAHRLLGPFDGSLACFAGLAVGLLLIYYKLPR